MFLTCMLESLNVYAPSCGLGPPLAILDQYSNSLWAWAGPKFCVSVRGLSLELTTLYYTTCFRVVGLGRHVCNLNYPSIISIIGLYIGGIS